MATHSSILPWKIPWTEDPGWYSPWGPQKLDTTEQLAQHSPVGWWSCTPRGQLHTLPAHPQPPHLCEAQPLCLALQRLVTTLVLLCSKGLTPCCFFFCKL